MAKKSPLWFSPSSRLALAGVAGLVLPIVLGACGKKGGGNPGAKLSEADQQIMGKYESIRANLAADDLRGAQKAAAAMAETLKPIPATDPAAAMRSSADEVAGAPALDRARQAFKTMSADAVRLTNGVQGFYVINCPMTTNGDWVQTNTNIDNPYMGKIMHDCGEVKK